MDDCYRDRLIRLVVEVNLRRFDPVVWRRYLLAGVADAFRGRVAILIERFFRQDNDAIGSWNMQVVGKWSDEDMAFHGGSLQRVRQEGDFLNNPYWLDPLPQDSLVCFSGIERLGKSAYWEHCFVRQMLRPVSCGDGLLLACRDADLQMELHIFRTDGDDPFNERDKQMCLFLNDLLRCYMADLAPMSKPSMMSLPPRPRQVMTLLLKGYSEKEVADHMGISHQTVHDYVKTIYRHFKVGSRAQLTALYLGLNQESCGQLAFDLVENGHSVSSETSL